MILEQTAPVAVPASMSSTAPAKAPAAGTSTDGSRHWWLSALGQAGRAPGRWPTPPPGSDPRTARCLLSVDDRSPRVAREFGRSTLREWGLDGPAQATTSDDVSVVISELVTNALWHGLQKQTRLGGRPIQLALFGHPRRLIVVVTDPGTRGLPPASEDLVSDEGGRGLMVVEAMSTAWGWAPLGTGGKAVWASFDLSPWPMSQDATDELGRRHAAPEQAPTPGPDRPAVPVH